MEKKLKPKRILIVTQHYWPESFRVTDLADFFINKDCEVDILCGIPNYPRGKFFEGYSYFKNRKQVHDDVNIYRVFEIPRGSNSNLRIFLNYISFPIASLFHIPRLLMKKYDKIFVFETSPVLMALPAIVLGRLKGIETTMYVLDLWPENLFSVIDIKNPLLRRLVTIISHWHYKKTDKLIALSEQMKSRLLASTTKSEDKIMILPQACEKIYETDIQDKELSKRFANGFNILFTGSITPAQSFETILEAAKQLRNSGINDINWIIVGDGMSRHWLENEIKKADLESCFYLEGLKPMEEIPRYNNIADILIGCLVKSDFLEATIPAKVMSYIASGKPIVLAMDGEVQDLINNKIRCGLASPTEEATTLAKNIKTIYSLPPSERNKMGARARNYHFKHFERNIILGKLFDFIFN